MEETEMKAGGEDGEIRARGLHSESSSIKSLRNIKGLKWKILECVFVSSAAPSDL